MYHYVEDILNAKDYFKKKMEKYSDTITTYDSCSNFVLVADNFFSFFHN